MPKKQESNGKQRNGSNGTPYQSELNPLDDTANVSQFNSTNAHCNFFPANEKMRGHLIAWRLDGTLNMLAIHTRIVTVDQSLKKLYSLGLSVRISGFLGCCTNIEGNESAFLAGVGRQFFLGEECTTK